MSRMCARDGVSSAVGFAMLRQLCVDGFGVQLHVRILVRKCQEGVHMPHGLAVSEHYFAKQSRLDFMSGADNDPRKRLFKHAQARLKINTLTHNR